MPLASEVTTTQEPHVDGGPAGRLRTKVRTNAGAARFKRRLEMLGLLRLAETIDRVEANWFWTGTGRGYEILWRDTTTVEDLHALAHL
jgi:hypothetical protein